LCTGLEIFFSLTHTLTHTHTHIYIYIYIFVIVVLHIISVVLHLCLFGLNLTCSPQITTVRESTTQTADSDVLVLAPSSSIWSFDLVVCNAVWGSVQCS
jgi:hypothetical protein